MADIVKPPLFIYTYNDGRLIARWWDLNGENFHNTQVVARNDKRIASVISIGGLIPPARILFGGPTGEHGAIDLLPTVNKPYLIIRLNADDSLEMCRADMWIEANVNPGDGAYVEVECCEPPIS